MMSAIRGAFFGPRAGTRSAGKAQSPTSAVWALRRRLRGKLHSAGTSEAMRDVLSRLAAYPPLRRRGVPRRGGNGAARDFRRAERAEGGSGADEHAERAGQEEVRAGGVEAASGKLDGGRAEQGGLVDRQARAAGRL